MLKASPSISEGNCWKCFEGNAMLKTYNGSENGAQEAQGILLVFNCSFRLLYVGKCAASKAPRGNEL